MSLSKDDRVTGRCRYKPLFAPSLKVCKIGFEFSKRFAFLVCLRRCDHVHQTVSLTIIAVVSTAIAFVFTSREFMFLRIYPVRH